MSSSTDQLINVVFPEAEDLELKFTLGPCRMKIVPGAGEEWVVGEYRDPSENLPLVVETNGNRTRISHKVERPRRPSSIRVPSLDLQLGAGKPYRISIESGANELELELGGVPLTGFECKFGAGKVDLAFGQPNPAQMKQFVLSAGAAEINLSGLANANAAELSFDGGAAAVRFGFDGTLQRDCHARVNAGAAGLEILIPSAMAARVAAKTTLAGISVGDGFQTRDGAYWTAAGIAGEKPLLSIDATVALAGLKIRMV